MADPFAPKLVNVLIYLRCSQTFQVIATMEDAMAFHAEYLTVDPTSLSHHTSLKHANGVLDVDLKGVTMVNVTSGSTFTVQDILASL